MRTHETLVNHIPPPPVDGPQPGGTPFVPPPTSPLPSRRSLLPAGIKPSGKNMIGGTHPYAIQNFPVDPFFHSELFIPLSFLDTTRGTFLDFFLPSIRREPRGYCSQSCFFLIANTSECIGLICHRPSFPFTFSNSKYPTK